MVSEARPKSFEMLIQGGMLQALGINMYSTVGKCLVEFIANAYDGNASSVELTIPFEEIAEKDGELRAADRREKARLKKAAVAKKGSSAVASRKTAKASATAVASSPLELPDVSLYAKTLSPEVSIVIKDDGHGMSPHDVATKFLPINRHRRSDPATGEETVLKSEGGKRAVMGRKGLGKLAGFGIANQVQVRTKRRGDDFWTIFELDAVKLAEEGNLGRSKIPATYENDPDKTRSGTTITLKALKPDAVRADVEKITDTIAEAFYGIDPGNFLIELNAKKVEAAPVTYDFIYPPEAEGAASHLAADTIEIPDVGILPISYAVKFRAPGNHLTAGKRGARIYCNKRLAAGPSLMKLTSGMHNFHSQDYLECVVVADTLDQLGVDFVNTNRTQLREDNAVVDTVLSHVSRRMSEGLAAHSKFRDNKAADDIKADPASAMVMKIIERLQPKSRKAAFDILRSFAKRYGVESTEFKEVAPLLMDSMNAGEVLVKLLELETDAKTVSEVAGQLAALADIERSDVLKLYRARRSAIVGLRKLIEKGGTLWKQKGIEAELHSLFKKDPWLIKPEYSRYFTSDQDLTKIASKLAKELKVDKYSPPTKASGKPDVDRPDLVFLMSDLKAPHEITIVEFKSPSIPLVLAHLNQLKGYMRRVSEFLDEQRFAGAGGKGRKITVTGYLIGAMPKSNTKNDDERALIYEMDRRAVGTDWDVLGLERVLENAQITHGDAITAYERERPDDVAVAVGSSDSKSKPKPRAAAKKSVSKTAPAPSASRRKR